jgi:hypothetical protein
MQVKKLLWLGLTVSIGIGSALAQVRNETPDWQEEAVPPPPAFGKVPLVPIEMPPYVSLRFGVDPGSLVITSDGVVRYVMVATSPSGAMNAMYEGIRCATGEVKTYALYGAAGQWAPVQDPKWRGLNENMPSKHALALARQGACDTRSSTARSVQAIINELKHPGQGLIR